MGGVNDYRAGTYGWTVVQHLKALKEKCAAYGIIPVFVTPTPINPSPVSYTHLRASAWCRRPRRNS